MRITFSKYFKLNKKQRDLDFFDVPVDKGDARVFVDPILLKKLGNSFSSQAIKDIQIFFKEILENIRQGKKGRAVELLVYCDEPYQTKLGYSRERTGTGMGLKTAEKMYEAFSKSSAVKSGRLEDIEDTALLTENVAEDRISDIVISSIKKHLIAFTQKQCKKYKVPLEKVEVENVFESGKWFEKKEVMLPVVRLNNNKQAIILVPKKILRTTLALNGYSFYNKYILDYRIMHPCIRLVKILNEKNHKFPNKKNKITKVEAREVYPYSKQELMKSIEEISEKDSSIISMYKEDVMKNAKPLTDERLEKIANTY